MASFEEDQEIDDTWDASSSRGFQPFNGTYKMDEICTQQVRWPNETDIIQFKHSANTGAREPLIIPNTRRQVLHKGSLGKAMLKLIDDSKLCTRTQTHRSSLDEYLKIVSDIDVSGHSQYIKVRDGSNVNCKRLKMHHRANRADPLEDSTQFGFDPIFKQIFYMDVLDTLHCYIYHLYDAGLRTHNKSFTGMCVLSKVTKDYNFWVKSSRYGSSKFNIVSSRSSDETFMDALLNNPQIRNWLMQEAYDTESLLLDVSGSTQIECNVGITMKTTYKNIMEYVNDYLGMPWCIFSSFCACFAPEIINLPMGCSYIVARRTFSIGFIFYYWDFYQKPRSYRTSNDHSGYQPHQLYVKQKYKNLKEEVTNNTIFSLTQRELSLTTTKMDEYMKTLRVLRIKSSFTDLKCGIKPGSIMRPKNVLSICLYCDWTDLSAKFSSTFRQLHPFETLKSVKRRNREFAIWSKTLRETIECYGQKGWDYDKDKKWNEEHNRVQGPFYCGTQDLLAIPQFGMRLCGPTSTSRHLEVAMRFSGEEGCILEFDNNGYFKSEEIKSFDCSWISTYLGEAEHLFMGGSRRVQLITVRNIKTAENYETWFKSLYYFDCMFSGIRIGSVKAKNIQKVHNTILSEIVNSKLQKTTNENMPKYIMDTFGAYCNHKYQIILNLAHIERYFEDIMPLILNNERGGFHRDVLKESISFKSEIFELFPNVQDIDIITDGFAEDLVLDEDSIMSLITDNVYKMRNVMIALTSQENGRISKLWKQGERKLLKSVNGMGWSIDYKIIEAHDDLKKDCFILSRLYS